MNKFDKWNWKGATSADQLILRKYIKKNIELTIDDGKIYTETGKYIADAVQDEENGVGIAIQNEKPRGGARKGTGPKKRLPEGARRRNIAMTDNEHEKVLVLLEEMRK
jgi:hypothetical protein